MKNKILIHKKLILIMFLLVTALSLVMLSFSYTSDGRLIFMSGLFLEDKTIFDFSFTISILGTVGLILCAIGLNTSGEVMQAVTSNPLASPFSLGLTSSINLVYIINASVKYVLNPYWIGLLSFLFILIFNITPIYFINKNKHKKNQNNTIYFGIAVSTLLTTLTLILVHIYQLDVYVYGWITNYLISLNTEKILAGSLFIGIGLLILIFNVKNISIFENMKSKSTTLGINNTSISIIALIGASFLAIGASTVYAPMVLIGLVFPYLSKKFIIKKFSFKESILISSLLSIIFLIISKFFSILTKVNDYNLSLTIMLLPIWICCESVYFLNRSKQYATK